MGKKRKKYTYDTTRLLRTSEKEEGGAEKNPTKQQQNTRFRIIALSCSNINENRRDWEGGGGGREAGRKPTLSFHKNNDDNESEPSMRK